MFNLSRVFCTFILMIHFTCKNETKFDTKTRVKRSKTPKISEDIIKVLGEDNEEFNALLGGDGIILKSSFSTSTADNSVWIASSVATVHKIFIDKNSNYPMQTWTGSGGGGHRTFVGKIGLIIGTTGGHVYRAGDNVPNGPVEKILTVNNPRGGTRICLVSYEIDGTDYIGGGYTSNDDKRTFSRSKLMNQIQRGSI